MEKIAIISDIHANLSALRAVMADIESKNVDKLFCLGDYVVKCTRPAEVIDLLREKCDGMIKGNCDDTLCRPGVEPGKFWSRDLIGEERTEFIYNLPNCIEFYLSGQLVRLFHATPFSNSVIFNPAYNNNDKIIREILDDPAEMFKNNEYIGKKEVDKTPDVVGYGHIHTQNFLRFGNKTLFNPGSVGNPVEMENSEGGDKEKNMFSTMASYAILTGDFDSRKLGSISFDFIRVPYDIKEEIEELEKSDMPFKDRAIEALNIAYVR